MYIGLNYKYENPELVDLLEKIVENRREKFDFYKELYPENLEIDSLKDFQKVPDFGKEEILDTDKSVSVVFEEAMCDAKYTLSTSGTSGTATVTLFSEADEKAQRRKYEKFEHYVSEGEKSLVIHGLSIQRQSIWPLLESANRFYAFTYQDDTGMAAELVKEIEPECIWTSPTIALKLADSIDKQGYREKVQKLILVGEPLSEDRKDLLREEFPEANYYMLYGQAEAGHLGYQCEELAGTNTYHIFPEHHLYEVLSRESVDSEDKGELVVTNLTEDSSIPFTRYRTGDRVRVDKDVCGCEEASITVMGRIKFDRLKISGITVYRENFEDALATVSDLVKDDYQIHIYEEGSEEDIDSRMEVHLIPRTDADRSERIREEVEEGIMENFTVAGEDSWKDAVKKDWLLPIEVKFVEGIGEGVKTKPVVDHRLDE